MVVSLFNTTSDSNVVDKTITSVRSDVQCQVKSPVNIYKPEIILTLPESIGAFNYAQIKDRPFNGRYYFVQPYTVNANRIVTIPLVCDVLSSNKTELRSLSGIIDRQENEGNMYITDGSFPVENKNLLFYKQFNDSLDASYTYYVTIGG